MASAMSRRALFAGALGALAGVAVKAVPGAADTGDALELGSIANEADAKTVLRRTTDGPTFRVTGSDASGEGTLTAHNTAGSAIVGTTNGGVHDPAVIGWSGSSRGVGVFGTVEMSGSGEGIGVYGQSSIDDGIGVKGSAFNVGVFGLGDTAGVQGTSDAGRGGIFRGQRSQLRLVPSKSPTHPAQGMAGDLFLDRSSRLWLCKGGRLWVRLA